MKASDMPSHYYLISNTRSIVAKSTYRDKPNWALVKDMFGCGATKAHEICHQSNIDPDDTVVRFFMRGKAP